MLLRVTIEVPLDKDLTLLRAPLSNVEQLQATQYVEHKVHSHNQVELSCWQGLEMKLERAKETYSYIVFNYSVWFYDFMNVWVKM